MIRPWNQRFVGLVSLSLVVWTSVASHAADRRATPERGRSAAETLTSEQWEQVDLAVDQGLAFVAKRQQSDGSFEAPVVGQPGITSLAVMAFLSRGHLPGEGPYGEQLDRALEYVLSSQREDGLLCDQPIGSFVHHQPSHTAIYSHGISGVMLSEAYGMASPDQQTRMGPAIIKALEFTRRHQLQRKRNGFDEGGWRYLRLRNHLSDADLSVTAWQLMFLRSALNAGFEMPQEYAKEAMGYVRRCFDARRGSFMYCQILARNTTPAMAGAGIVSLSMGGEHDSQMARSAGRWVLTQSFNAYNRPSGVGGDRYHYGIYYWSQAMYQLGGEYWAGFYPRIAQVLVRNQRSDGSWDAESGEDRHYGPSYTTALSVLALTPPYQILPIYQR